MASDASSVRVEQVDPYAHANPVFLAAVCASPLVSPVVLDVGCWNGTFGKALLRLRSVVVDGVELDASQAAAARQAGYRNVQQVDLDGGNIASQNEGYDFILFGDVLEHLKTPERVLAASRKLLKPGGQVLVSVPNIAYILSRLKLLLGKWEYTDSGIMDRTHLRFYTVRSIRRLLGDCGFEHAYTRGYVGLANYPAPIRILARWLGRVWPSLFAIQIVVCGRDCVARESFS
jgi:SAM-dependent methyltransferase